MEDVPEDREGVSQSGVLQGCWNQPLPSATPTSLPRTLLLGRGPSSGGQHFWRRNHEREVSHVKGVAWAQAGPSVALFSPASLLPLPALLSLVPIFSRRCQKGKR